MGLQARPEDHRGGDAGRATVTGAQLAEPDRCPPGTCQSPTERGCAFFGCARPTIFRAWVDALNRNAKSVPPGSAT